jgi:hypothetical protein
MDKLHVDAEPASTTADIQEQSTPTPSPTEVANAMIHVPPTVDDTIPSNRRDESHRGNDPPGEISNSSSYRAYDDNNINDGAHPKSTVPETKNTNLPGASSKISPGDALEQPNRRGVVMFGDVLEIREGSDTQTSSLQAFEKTRAPNRKKLFMPYERINPVLPNTDSDSDNSENKDGDNDLKPKSQTDE